MSTRKEWDFALHIKGVSMDTLDLARLGDYMKEFASLLGQGSSPKFAGIVKGSVVMRARDCGEHPAITRNRLQQAANDEAPAHAAFSRISSLLRQDGARGQVLDRGKNVIVSFAKRTAANDDAPEVIIPDTAELDGVVVGIIGTDDTAHVKLQQHGGTVISITVRDMSLARELAKRFRLESVRIHTHGTWKRTKNGVWEPHAIYADRLEDIDQKNAHDVFTELAAVPGNGWAHTEDADALWRKIRGLDDSSS